MSQDFVVKIKIMIFYFFKIFHMSSWYTIKKTLVYYQESTYTKDTPHRKKKLIFTERNLIISQYYPRDVNNK